MTTAKKILCIDIEATCWEGRPPNNFPEQRNEIIEIGVTEIDIASKRIERSEGILVKPPTTEISEFCTQLTTITPELIAREGVDFRTAMIRLSAYRPERNVWASWGDYDRKSFEKNCRWNDENYPFSNMHLNVKSLFGAKFGWNGRLDKCAEHLGIAFEGTHHRGVDDSRMVAKVLLKLLS